MKVTVLYTPSIWNIGNDFINQGARYLLGEIFSAWNEDEVYEVELLETANSGFNYPTNIIPPTAEKTLESSDLIVVVGGSCLSRYYTRIFEKISQYKAKKWILGASFYENINGEKELYKDLHSKFDFISVRDETTWKVLSNNGEHKNVYSGIDLSFYISDFYREYFELNERQNYSIVNIDSPEKGEMQRKFYKENSWLMWNNPTKIGHANNDNGKDKNIFIAEKWFSYVQFIAHAEEVHTNRVHTLAMCFLFGTPCTSFFGNDAVFARYYMFKKLGLEVVDGRKFEPSDYGEAFEKCKIFKKELIQKLKDEANNCNSN